MITQRHRHRPATERLQRKTQRSGLDEVLAGSMQLRLLPAIPASWKGCLMIGRKSSMMNQLKNGSKWTENFHLEREKRRRWRDETNLHEQKGEIDANHPAPWSLSLSENSSFPSKISGFVSRPIKGKGRGSTLGLCYDYLMNEQPVDISTRWRQTSLFSGVVKAKGEITLYFALTLCCMCLLRKHRGSSRKNSFQNKRLSSE